MKRLWTFLPCFILLCSFLAAEELKPNTLSPEEKAEGFQLLFDGEKLSPEIWQSAIDGYPVEDGVFVCRKGGNLLTVKEYGDFVLRFEFVLPPGGNNGVGVRVEAPNKDAAYNGMELQILDNSAEKYKDLQPYQFHGSIYGVVASKRDPEKNDFLKPLGQWNYQEVTAIGSKIKVVLNGETIVDADLSEFKGKPTADKREHPGLHREKGFLGFLGHGDPVRFRNVRVKELNPPVEKKSIALTPDFRLDSWWFKRHGENVELMHKGDIDLLMIGDSITNGWNGKVWNRYYKHRKPINMGFSGDRTEHVLWRFNHLPWNKIKPKAAVVMIGTNNVGHSSSSPKDAADGIKAIVEKLGQTYPEMKILVLHVFSRSAKPEDDMRKKVDEINSYLPELLKDMKNVTLLDLNGYFLDADGNLTEEIMPDRLHLSEKGYGIWAQKMEPTLSKLLGDEAVKAEE